MITNSKFTTHTHIHTHTHIAAVYDTVFSVLILETVAKLKYLRITAVNQNYIHG